MDVRTNYLVTATASVADEVVKLHKILQEIHSLADGRTLGLKVKVEAEGLKELRKLREELGGRAGGGATTGSSGGAATATPSGVTKGEMRSLIQAVQNLVTRLGGTGPARPAYTPRSAGAAEPEIAGPSGSGTAAAGGIGAGRGRLEASQKRLLEQKKRLIAQAQAVRAQTQEALESISEEIEEEFQDIRSDSGRQVLTSGRGGPRFSEALENIARRILQIDKAIENRAKAIETLEKAPPSPAEAAVASGAPRLRRSTRSGPAGALTLDFSALQGAVDHVANLLQTKLASAIQNLPNVSIRNATPGTAPTGGSGRVFTLAEATKYLEQIGNVTARRADLVLRRIEAGQYLYQSQAHEQGVVDRIVRALESRAGRVFAGAAARDVGREVAEAEAITQGAALVAPARRGPRPLADEERERRQQARDARFADRRERRRKQVEDKIIAAENQQIAELQAQILERQKAGASDADLENLRTRADALRQQQAMRRDALARGRVLFDVSRLSGARSVDLTNPQQDIQKRYKELRASGAGAYAALERARVDVLGADIEARPGIDVLQQLRARNLQGAAKYGIFAGQSSRILSPRDKSRATDQVLETISADPEQRKILETLKSSGLSTGGERFLAQFIPQGAQQVPAGVKDFLTRLLDFRQGFVERYKEQLAAGQLTGAKNVVGRYQKALPEFLARQVTDGDVLAPEDQQAIRQAFSRLDEIRPLTRRKAAARSRAAQRRADEISVDIENFGQVLPGATSGLRAGQAIQQGDAYKLVRGMKEVQDFLSGLDDVDLVYKNKGNAAQVNRLAQLRQQYPELQRFLGPAGRGAESKGFRQGALAELKTLYADLKRELSIASAQRPGFGGRPETALKPEEIQSVQDEVKRILALLGGPRLDRRSKEALQTRLEFLGRVAGADAGIPNEFAQRDYFRRDAAGNIIEGQDVTPTYERAGAIAQYRGRTLLAGGDPAEGLSTIDAAEQLAQLRAQRAGFRQGPKVQDLDRLSALYGDVLRTEAGVEAAQLNDATLRPLTQSRDDVRTAKALLKEQQDAGKEEVTAKELLAKAERDLAAATAAHEKVVNAARREREGAADAYRAEIARQLGPEYAAGALVPPSRLTTRSDTRFNPALSTADLDRNIRDLERNLARRAAQEQAALRGAAGGGAPPGGDPPKAPPGDVPDEPPRPAGGGDSPDVPLEKRLGVINDRLNALRDLNLQALVNYFAQLAQYSAVIGSNLKDVQRVIDPVTRVAAQRAVREDAKRKQEQQAKTSEVAVDRARRSEYAALLDQYGGGQVTSDGILRQINTTLSRLTRLDRTVRENLNEGALRAAQGLPDAKYLQRASDAALSRVSVGKDLGVLSGVAAGSTDPQLRDFARTAPTLKALKAAADARAEIERQLAENDRLLQGGESARESLRNALFANETARRTTLGQVNPRTNAQYTTAERAEVEKRFAAQERKLRDQLTAYGSGDDALVARNADLQQRRRGALGEEQRLLGVLRQQAGAAAETAKHIGVQHNFAERLVGTFERLSYYLGASFVLYNLVDSLRQAVAEAVRLEATVARIQGVLGQFGATSRARITSDILQAAATYGTSVGAAGTTYQTFAQAGFRGAGLTSVVRSSLAAEAGAGLLPEQAQELLIAINALTESTNVLSAKAITFSDIIDRISRIEANYAVSAQDLAVAVQRVGSLAQQLQPEAIGRIDFADLVIGATTEIVERTRVTGNQAATSLRFILARLSAPETSRALNNKFDIPLFSDAGGRQLRPVIDILSDIAAKYQALTKSGDTFRAQQLLQVVAGARQINAASALFADFGRVIDIARESSLAFGETQARLALQMGTLDRQFGRLGASFQQFMTGLLTQIGILGGPGAKGVGALASGFSYAAKDPGAALAVGGLGVSLVTQLLRPRTVGVPGQAGPLGGIFDFLGKILGWFTRLGGASRLASIARVTTLVGAALLAIEGILALVNKFSDKLAPATIDLATIRNTDEYRQYQARAELVGSQLKPGQQLSDVVFQSAARARAAVAERLGLGPEYFAQNDKDAKTDPRLRKALQDEFVRQLIDAGVELQKFGDATAQTAGAYDLLKDAIKITRFEPSFRAGEFQTRVEDFLTAAEKNAEEFLKDPKLFKALTELDLNADPQYRTNVIAASLDKLTGGLLRGFDSVNGLIGAQGRAGSFADLIQLSARPGQLLGHAIDQTFLDTFIEQSGDDAATRKRKAAQYDALVEFLRRRQRQEGGFDRLLGAAGGAGGLAATSQGELTFRQVFAASREALRRDLKVFQSRGVDVGPSLDLLATTERSGNAQSFTRDRLGELAGRALRSRLVEILGNFRVQSDEINLLGGTGAGRGLFGRAGITYDRDRERQSALETLARQYGRLESETRFEIARIETQLPKDFRTRLQQIELRDTVTGDSGEAGRQLALEYTRSALAAAQDTVGLDEGTLKSLGERFEVLNQQLTLLTSDKALLDGLSTESRNFLTEALAQAAKVDPAKVAESGAFTQVYGSRLIEIALTAARQQTFQRERRQAALGLSQDLTTRRFDQRLRTEEVLRGGRLRVAQARGFGPGLREELTQIGEAVATQLERARLESAQRTQQLELDRGTLSPQEFAAREQDLLEQRRNAELLAIEDGEARRRELLTKTFNDLTAQQIEAQNQAALSGTAGFKDLFNVQSFFPQKEASDNFFGRIAQGLIGPAAQTISERLAEGLQDSLFGAEGLFGSQARALFGQTDEQRFASRIEQAHAIGANTAGATLDRSFLTGADVVSAAIRAAFDYGAARSEGPAAGSANSFADQLFLDTGLGPEKTGGAALLDYVTRQQRANNIPTGVDINSQLANQAYLGNREALPGLNTGGKDASPERAARMKALKAMVANLIGQYAGAAIGTAIGGKYSYAGEGSAIGSALGGAGFGPVGGLVGGLLGGALGGLFGKDKPKKPPEYTQLERLERTAQETVQAINNQTDKLLSVDNRVLNAPSNFNVPAYAPMLNGSGAVAAGAVSQTVQITIQDARDPEATAKAVQRILQQETRRQGSFTATRY